MGTLGKAQSSLFFELLDGPRFNFTTSTGILQEAASLLEELFWGVVK